MLSVFLAFALLGKFPQLRVTEPAASEAPFEQFPATDADTGEPVQPVIKSKEERQAAKVLQDAVVHGWGVVDGGTEHERKGVNFDGHYVLVQWACGSNCMQAALIDGRDGSVLKLPHLAGDEETGFRLPTGSADLRTLEFRWNSALLGVPQIANGKTYYYRLVRKRWQLVTKKSTPAGHD